eukprot:scaffold54253_cov57-Phaeocystis_antarctica.AAC.2
MSRAYLPWLYHHCAHRCARRCAGVQYNARHGPAQRQALLHARIRLRARRRVAVGDGRLLRIPEDPRNGRQAPQLAQAHHVWQPHAGERLLWPGALPCEARLP